MSNIVPLRSGGQVTSIIPQTIEEVFRLAKAIAASGLAPNGMKAPEQITVAILHGAELGLPPMQSVQRIAVVNGRPTIWGDAVPALLLSRGFKIREWMAGIAGSTRCAWCEITRPDGDKIERSFSEVDAMTAGLWGKQGPWKQYPARMLQMRARGFAARDGAADVLAGLYMTEEIDGGDITPRSAALDVPDIPDATAEPAVDQASVLRDLQRALETRVGDGKERDIADIEREFATAIMAMDDDGTEAAVEMIQAAKGEQS